jgi:hypothetical protein
MSRFNKIAYVLLVGFIVSGLFFMAGCKKAGTSTSVGAAATTGASTAKLEEARGSVIEAEKKLNELRAERIQLEKEWEAKKSGVK